MRILRTCLWALLLHAGIAIAGEYAQGVVEQPVNERPGLKQDQMESSHDLSGLTRIKSSILSQVLMFAAPQGFTTAFQDTEEKKFTQEFILDEESVDKWSEMIMVIGYKGLASSPLATPLQHVTAVGNQFRRNCPDSYSGASLGERKIDGYAAYAAIMSCGLVKPEDPYSEATLFIVIRGDTDFYTLQWTERGMASSTPVRFDLAIWRARMDSLEPIRLCSDKPGEFPPYAGCFKPK